MKQEIEYKYLVDVQKWDKLIKPVPELIVQGYLVRSKDIVVRVRIMGIKGFLTLKGKTTGISRTEFEYEIPLQDAEAMINSFTEKRIRKKRYKIEFGNKIWEVDVFEENLKGLILAELEVESETEVITLPDWVTDNVSEDPEYYNAVLIEKC